MSKAILIIDKPERWCVMCPCYELESGTCQALPNDDPLDHYDINDNRIIPKDCPLKEYKEAIPIEWLKRYEITKGQEVRLQDAINDWEKENEID